MLCALMEVDLEDTSLSLHFSSEGAGEGEGEEGHLVSNVPTFVINLDLPPSERWNDVASRYREQLKGAEDLVTRLIRGVLKKKREEEKHIHVTNSRGHRSVGGHDHKLGGQSAFFLRLSRRCVLWRGVDCSPSLPPLSFFKRSVD